jgi:putative SOS response-associated peptidase YedK
MAPPLNAPVNIAMLKTRRIFIDLPPPFGRFDHSTGHRRRAQRYKLSGMCGRYVSPDEASIEREFNLVHTEWEFPPSFNVAPTQAVPVVRNIDGARRGALMRWGLIPYFARGIPPKYSTINARIENVQTAASYRGPWERAQRCLVVARGFFEWQVQADGKTKVPYYIHANDQDIIAYAGLWDVSKTDAGDRIESVTHITLPANKLLGEFTTLSSACRQSW